MSKVGHGNCYQFDLPDDCLNDLETKQVIEALTWDLQKLPLGAKFVLDIAIGPDSPRKQSWEQFVASMRKFKRAEYEKETDTISERDAIEFLREHFADLLTLPRPGLRRIK